MRRVNLDVVVVACIDDVETRARWTGLLGRIEARFSAPASAESLRFRFESRKTLESAAELIQTLFKTPDTGVVLLSDAPLNARDHFKPGWQKMAEEFGGALYVSLAIAASSRRVPNIDLVLDRGCDEQTLLSGLTLLMDRLGYYAKPAKRSDAEQREIKRKLNIVPIESQTELREAFRLRHQVYRIMGYLGEDALDDETQLELNYCDLFSNHFGAFVTDERGAKELVGVARLILTKASDNRFKELIEATCRSNNSLRRLVERDRMRFAGFKLPIFHTFKALNGDMVQALRSNRPWAELSRVVVAPDWRGAGIARELVSHVVAAADELKTDVIFLECLDLHKKMYEEFDFSFFGERAEVMVVGRTMAGMRRNASHFTPSSGSQVRRESVAAVD